MGEQKKTDLVEQIEQLRAENFELQAQLQQMYGSSHEVIKAQSQLESILHNAGEGVIIFNPDNTIKSLNLAAEKILGFTEVELMFQYGEQLFDVPEGYSQKIPLYLKNFLEEYPNADEFPLMGNHVKGHKVPLRLSISEIASEQMMFFDDFTDEQALSEESNELKHNFGLFACILHDLSSELETKRKLEEQNKKLEIAYLSLSEQDRMRGEFLAKVSHELLTPLNGILGVADILTSKVSEENQELVHVIQDSGNRLNGIINNILVFDQNKVKNEDVKHSFEFVSLVDELLEKQNKEILIKSLDVKVTFSPSPDKFRLFGFEHKLESLLFNLLDNAVKFTESGFVHLSFNLLGMAHHNSSKRLEIVVSDSGIGIAEENMGIIFEPFTQCEDTVTRQYGGIGMGLSIVNQITESLDGFVVVESELGKGSTFTVELCIESSEQQIANISTVDQNKIQELKELLGDDYKAYADSIQVDLEKHLDQVMLLADTQSFDSLKTEFSVLMVLAEQIGARKLMSELEELQKMLNKDRSSEWVIDEVSKISQEIQKVTTSIRSI
ncbi:MAG: PAS domain S-box protein [Gammaproteobacteria bacterium]|nr:PAS domain S-box protein [Gammaproteobacteria bacterium]